MEMSLQTRAPSQASVRLGAAPSLLPLMGAVFAAFLVAGLAMPVLPLHVHRGLGLGPFGVGLIAASQFAAAAVSRLRAGRHADSRGASHAVTTGLLLNAAGGLLYLLSPLFLRTPVLSAAILFAGRAVLGAGESFVITGAQAWGLALAGPSNAGAVIGWMGTAMYAALALGAPLGTALYGSAGFTGIAAAATAVPFVALAWVVKLPRVAAAAAARPPLTRLLRAIWLPGVALSLASAGFGAMTAFMSLLFAARGWTVWPAFTAFTLAFIAARTLLGRLADRKGGAKIALIFLLWQAAGQAMLWLAPSAPIGLLGAGLTGFGYSLVYPALGVEAVRRAPREHKGMAMGGYTAFLDVALAATTPLLGLLAAARGIGVVFLASAVCALSAVPVTLTLMKRITIWN